ncbi:MAG: SH3 domain-containing protein [Chloroflexota bacterium]
MTDDPSGYGLGALPDAPDERDYPVSAPYASEGLTASVVLPASYAAPGMPPVLNQHATPMCVAYSSSAMKAWQDRRDQEAFFDFDEPAFFAAIGGTAQGARVRAAMERMRSTGYPVASVGDPGGHRIAAYYAVPRDVATIKAAIHDLGPIVVSTPWYQSWFHPAAGVLPEPDTQVGGHAIVAYGWDQRGLRLRNSWGVDWGVGGDCWMPESFVPHISGAWKAVDAIEHPIAYAHTVGVLARPSLNVRRAPTTAAAKVASLPYGRDVATTRLEKYGGKYTVNGAVRTDWFEVRAGTRTGWIARGYTRLVR